MWKLMNKMKVKKSLMGVVLDLYNFKFLVGSSGICFV